MSCAYEEQHNPICERGCTKINAELSIDVGDLHSMP
jgi:hypothetical protein